MEKCFLITIVIIPFVALSAQLKVDLLYADRWRVLTDCRMNFDVDWVEKDFYVVKDTIIGKYTYQLLNNKKCIRYSDDGMQFYYLGDSAEYLLCDYSLDVGDTCYAYMGDVMFDNMEQILLNAGYKLVQPWIVKSKDIIDQRIHMKMSCSYTASGKAYESETEMIQGIGSRHFIFPFVTSAWFIGGAPSYTLCAFHDDENVYSFDLTELGIVNNCPQWSVITDDNVTIRTQSAVKKIIKNGQLYIQKDGRTFNSLGQEIIVKDVNE